MIVDFFTEVVYQRVLVGTLIIGCTCGVLGTFTYLRRQSLMADVIGHSSMLGVTLAFLLSVLVLRIDGRNMLVIVGMSALVGLCSAALTSRIAGTTRLGTDASMAVVLAVTFGGGMALLNEINARTFPSSKSGLRDYIFGRATTLLWADVWVSLGLALLAVAGVLALWRQIQLFVFDPVTARVLGVRVGLVDAVLTAATVIAVVVGLKAVGLVLVIAYVVFPAVAARQWTNSCATMALLAGAFGMVASVAGAILSVAYNVPSGPTTVLVLTAIGGVSLAAAPKRSLLVSALRRRQARAALVRQLEEGRVRG
ncbi:MAG: metal ABC transporter permease [Actinomycetaceae bacterium]|nr:metal ABC transporter permease [Actinomycetaceae bacterium]